MSSESLIAYVNGEYVPKDQARISVFDFGFLRGDAVFDTTSAWNGRIFKLPAHLERLELSLRAARIRARCPSKAAGRRDRGDDAPVRPAQRLHPDHRHARRAAFRRA
jgi:hypothetical protein